MPEIRLTERRIQELKPPADRAYERYWDTEISGLFVKVLQSGKKFYGFKARLDGKTVWGTRMPACSEISVADMREQALQWKIQIRKGENPWKVSPREEKRTVHQLCLERLEMMSNRTIKPFSPLYLSDRRLMTKWIGADPLGKLSVAEVTVAEAESFLQRYYGRTAEGLRAWLRSCYNFAIGRSYVPLGFNPWKYCERRYLPPEPEELPRCTDAEIASIATYLERSGDSICPVWRAYVWFLIRTGARPSDARKIQRQWLQQRAGSWIIEHPSTKTGKRTMVLASEVVTDLSHIPRIEGNVFLFPGQDGRSMCKKKFYRLFGIMRREIDLEKPPYAIRRWFANTGRRVFDGDIKPVQQLCGWETEDIAERYAGNDEALMDSVILQNAGITSAISARIEEVIGR